MATKKQPKKTAKKAKKHAGKTPQKGMLKTVKPKAKKVAPVAAKAKEKKPSGEKTTENNKEALRRLLIQKREHIIKEAKTEISKYIKGETRQLVDTALDDGDWATVDLAEDVSFKQLGTHRETLVKIDAAIRKLTEGTYGICEECGEEISEERLKVMPFAIYCRDCQENIEQLEAIEKEL